MDFKEFVNNLDYKEIKIIYQKAQVAVDLVRMYNSKLLDNIATVADLPQGAYGLYNSGENKKILPPETEKSLIGWGKVGRDNLNNLPVKLIQQYYPQIPVASIQKSDTIRVNVRRILREFPDDTNRILQIACTIVHEVTHEIDRETTGQAGEPNAIVAEKQFINWVQKNWQNISTRFPDLKAANPTITPIDRHS